MESMISFEIFVHSQSRAKSDIREPNLRPEHHGKLTDPGKQTPLFDNRASSVTCPTRSLPAYPRGFWKLILPLFPSSLQSTFLPFTNLPIANRSCVNRERTMVEHNNRKCTILWVWTKR